MDDATKRRFKRTHISRRDFAKSIGFINAAMNHGLGSLEYEALLLSAIVSYARPFSGNEQGNSPPSDKRLAMDVSQVLGADFALHERLIEIRNKAVAHSESAFYPVELLSSTPQGGSGFASVCQNWHVLNEHIDLAVFKRMAEALCGKCANNLFDIHFAGSIKARP